MRIEADVPESLPVHRSKLGLYRIRCGGPRPDRAVLATGHDRLAVGREGGAVQDPIVPEQLGEHPPGADVPNAPALILAGGGERLPIRAEREARDCTFVAAELHGPAR